MPFSWADTPGSIPAIWAPFSDNCQSGFPTYCDLWAGQVPDKCFIGAMGWLLTCRKPYLEGIDVLYKTNCFHIKGFPLLCRLPSLLPQPRLADITAVELLWDLDPPESSSKGISQGCDKLKVISGLSSMMESLTTTLPILTRMYLSLRGTMLFPSLPSQELFETTELLLDEIDASLYKLHNLIDCRMAIPSSSSIVCKQRAQEFHDTQSHREAWIEQAGAIRRTKWLSTRSKQAQRDSMIGYWICEGLRDLDSGLIRECTLNR